MFKLKSIGNVVCNKNITSINIDKEYNKALKHLDKFSHIHIFYVQFCEKGMLLDKIILKIKQVNIKEGQIIVENMDNRYFEGVLIDIKPYFPCEDTVKNAENISKNINSIIKVNETATDSGFDIDTVGDIRNVNGDYYIQLNQMINISSNYIKVYWWFHKFDSDKYREITQCNPPYEDAPKTGVFATRSPVRPNPIAMTVAKVIRIDKDKNRIYINGIESFDKTPCIGISEYTKNEDCILECSVPSWLEHWPSFFDDSIKNKDLKKIEIKNSSLEKLLQNNIKSEKYIQKDNKTLDVDYKKKNEITVYGARENNLKGINVSIPYGKITAVIGVSGSGKSSLVNDTIYAECARRMRYLSDNREMMQKPKIDDMTGCIPAVIITQDAIHSNALSTIGTYVDAYTYLRIIYASVSVRHCTKCGNEIVPLSREKILSFLSNIKDASIYDLSKCKIDKSSLENMVDEALEKGKGAFYIKYENEFVMLQTKQKCYHCDNIMFDITPSTFSYMDADSRCPVCNGTGKIFKIDKEKLIEDPKKSLLDGAISFYGKLRTFKDNSNANWMKGQVFGLAKKMDIDLERSWNKLPEDFKNILLHGSTDEVTFEYNNKKNGRNGQITRKVEGIYQIIERIYEENTNSSQLNKYMTKVKCSICDGERLSKEGRMAAVQDIRYPEAAKMTFYEIENFCEKLTKTQGYEDFIKIENAVRALKEIAKAAIALGIGYLPLDRETGSLSGGEGQRVKLLLASLNHITGILYIFDEPSKGLHPDDYSKIINMLRQLKREGNTIIMVEHNEDMIKIADNIIEIGSGAGKNGGMLIGEGTYEQMLNNNKTQLSKYINNKKDVLLKKYTTDKTMIKMKNMNFRNLKNINIEFPLNALICICGVSGSGKSSLMKGEIYTRAKKNNKFSNVVLVDQLPIGKTSKSIIATYIGIMDFIRSEFAATKLAIERQWNEKYFSFNGELGQCDTCKGDGRIKLKYINDAYTKCPDCKGKRYKKEVLDVLFKEKNVYNVLDMSVNEAIVFFNEYKKNIESLVSLKKVGLGYLRLGQGTSTLSGGEASRLKLAKELFTKKKENTLYLLDEPTTGLHFSDIDNLLILINELILTGNTVIAIEHNKQFVRYCDWHITLGYGAGENGGKIISQGKCKN